MAKITITFLEEGNDPVLLELPEETCAALEMFIEEQNINYNNQATIHKEQLELKYNGKADLFLKFTTENLLEPIIKRYGSLVKDNSIILNQISNLELQKQALEQQIINEFKPKLL